LQVAGLADLVIHHQVHARLDFVELSHFDPVLPQKIRPERRDVKRLGLAAIIDGHLADLGVRYFEVRPARGEPGKL
jgi:hypothetical protein